MTRAKKANYLRIVLSIQGISVPDETIKLIVRNLEAIERRKGELTLSEMIEIKHKK
jgi:hypothetical protein